MGPRGGSGGGGAKGGAEQAEASGGQFFKLAEVEVAKASDFGVNDTTYRCLTHLGAVLQPGDSVLGCVNERARVALGVMGQCETQNENEKPRLASSSS